MLSAQVLPGWTLFRKEILRFTTTPLQTLVAPVVTSSLFLFVFGVNLGDRISVESGFGYLEFVVPGLALMGVINNSFANTSSSLFFSRYIGNIVDLLVTPLSGAQMVLAYTAAAICRGLLVGAVVLLVSLFFTQLPWAYPVAAVAMAILTAFLLSQLGLIAAVYSDSFEALSMYNNFLLLPLIYLGGMFYPLKVLPPFWASFSKFNPLFYMIDGFRHSILGEGDVSLWTSFGVTAAVATLLFIWAASVIGTGHRLRT